MVKEAAMCKFLATTVAESTASKCVNWMGGNGITEQVHLRGGSAARCPPCRDARLSPPQYLAEKFYRDAKVSGC